MKILPRPLHKKVNQFFTTFDSKISSLLEEIMQNYNSEIESGEHLNIGLDEDNPDFEKQCRAHALLRAVEDTMCSEIKEYFPEDILPQLDCETLHEVIVKHINIDNLLWTLWVNACTKQGECQPYDWHPPKGGWASALDNLNYD